MYSPKEQVMFYIGDDISIISDELFIHPTATQVHATNMENIVDKERLIKNRAAKMVDVNNFPKPPEFATYPTQHEQDVLDDTLKLKHKIKVQKLHSVQIDVETKKTSLWKRIFICGFK
jgi:hypothetical protein